MATTITMLDPTGTPRQIPADQKDAALKGGGKIAVKMVDPKGTQRWVPEDQKDAAIQAGGKLADSAPEIDLTSNPVDPKTGHGEGTYHFQGPDGKEVEIPYSKALELLGHPEGALGSGQAEVDRFRDSVIDLQKKGYTLAQEDIPRLYADYSHDPKLKDVRAHNFAQSVPATGYARGLAKTITGLANIVHAPVPESVKKFAETPNANIMQSGAEAGEQIAELAVIPESKISEAAKLPKAVKLAAKVAEHGIRAAGEQGAQTYIKTGDTQEAKRAAEVGGIVGGAIPVAGEVMKKLGEFGADVGRFFLKVGDMQTGTMVRETEKANVEIAKKAEDVSASNAEKVRQAEKDHAKAVDKAKIAHDKKLKDAQSPVEKAQAKNEFKEKQAQLDHEHEVEKARLAHEQALADEQELQAKNAVASRHLLEIRGRLATRLQTLQNAAKDYFKKNYAEVEDAIGDKRTVPLQDLDDAVNDARGHFEGSDESVKVFNDISKKMHGVQAASEAAGAVRNMTPEEIAQLAPDEREMLRRGGSATKGPGVTFTDLKGYYSELGRQLASPSVPGDVKQAIVALRDTIDEMQQKLANDAGVGTRYKLLRNQYKNYAKGFLDYQGPNAAGSPVAYALKAEDAHNATKGFVGMEPEEISRVKQILAGKPTDSSTQFMNDIVVDRKPGLIGPLQRKEPAWRYRRDTTKLLDNFLDANSKADSLAKDVAKAKPVGDFVPPEYKAPKLEMVPEPKDVGEFKPPDAKPPKLDDVPDKIVKTPDDVRKLKEDNLLNRASLLNHFGTYMAVSGLVGSVFALTGGNPAERIERGAEGVLVGAVSPYLMARIVERPDVVKALTTVTRKDLDRLMKLSPEQRSGVEEGIKQLADTAVEKGKLKKSSIPWYRIIGSTAAVKAAKPGTTEAAAQGESTNDTQKDLDQMEQPVPQ